MPNKRRYKLTYLPESRRWKKVYRGKQVYIPLLDGETKQSSYQRALDEFERRKAEIDAQQVDRIQQRWLYRAQATPKTIYAAQALDSRDLFVDVLLRTHIDRWAVDTQTDLTQAQTQAILDHPQRWPEVFGFVGSGADERSNPGVIPAQDLVQQPRPQYGVIDNGTGSSDTRLDKVIDRFLETKKAEVDNDKLSSGRYDNIRASLDALKDYIGAGKEIAEVDSRRLTDYRQALFTKVAAKKLSDSRARDHLAVAQQLVRWAYRQEIIASLPKVVGSNDLVISVAAKKPELKLKMLSRLKQDKLLEFLSGSSVSRAGFEVVDRVVPDLAS